jgi:hypothetical protein
MTPVAQRCGRSATIDRRCARCSRCEDDRDGETATSGRTKRRPQTLVNRSTMRLRSFAANNGIDIARGGTMVVPNRNDTFPFVLTSMASPCRAGDIRSGPQAAKRGRAMRVNLEGWRRSAPIATSRSRHWGHSYPQPPLPAETPFDAASSAHCAGDMLADALVEHRLPRH